MGDTLGRDMGTERLSSVRCVVGTVALAALSMFAAAGCASDSQTTETAAERSATGVGDSTPVGPDVQRACARFVVTALSIDTTTDRGPGDARTRAARAHGVPELAARMQGHGKDPNWPLLAAHAAHVQVTTQPIADDPPPAQNDVAAAGVLADRVAVGAANWRHQLSETAAYCSLRRTHEGWKVTDLSFSDSSPSGTRQ